MYNNPYFNNVYNPQPSIDRINNQIAELEKLKSQMAQPQQMGQPAINQTFQLAPTNNSTIKYANSIDEVQKDIVIGDTPFFSKDMSVVWIKNSKGEIKAYTLAEIVQKDEKDLMIESLQMQLNEMKGLIQNAKSSSTNDNESTQDEESSSSTTVRTTKKK